MLRLIIFWKCHSSLVAVSRFMTSGLGSYVSLSVSYLNLVSQVFITDSSALFVAAHACCRCSNAHQVRHHLCEREAMRPLPYSSAALYPCCSDCKLSFSCNLLGGLAFYLDPEGSIFPFCWCLVFSSRVRARLIIQLAAGYKDPCSLSLSPPI